MEQDRSIDASEANDEPSAQPLPQASRATPTRLRVAWLSIGLGALLATVSAFMLARPYLGRLIPQRPQDVSQTAQVEDLLVTLRVDEADVGARTIDVLVTDAAKQPVDVDRVRLRLLMTDMAWERMSRRRSASAQATSGRAMCRCRCWAGGTSRR